MEKVNIMNATLERLAKDFWEFRLRTGPTGATLLGDHRFDDQIEDLSAETEAEHRSVLAGLADGATAVDPHELDRADRVTRAMLIDQAQQGIMEIDSGMMELRCDQMMGPHSWLLWGATQVTLPEPEHARAIVDRYRKIGGLLDQALERFREGLARGRTPARINVERSISMLDAYLASPLEADGLVNVQGPERWDGEPDWREQLRSVVRDEVRPSFERYRRALADELLPAARPYEKSGLAWLEDGEELYATAVQLHTSLSMPPEEIHGIGLDEITQMLPAQYIEVGARTLGTEQVTEILERLRSDPKLRFSSPKEIEEIAQATLERAQRALGEWFGVLPTTPCVIKEVPDYLAKDTPLAYYMEPAEDGSRPGTYFINVYSPKEKNRFEAESVSFHEAIPGHHLQIAISVELRGLPDFQRHALVTAFSEGWGLYAERLAEEMGLYSDDLQRLGMLSADSWRAGRLVVDSGLHHKGWSRQQAIDFLRHNSPVALDTIEVEVDRYIGWPGQALAYKIGQREILRLREEARAAMGEAFDIRGFHDAVLTSGTLTLPLLRELVDDWVGGEGGI